MEKIEKWEMEGENGKQEEERDVVMAGMFLHLPDPGIEPGSPAL